jgi:hypothetical protein
VKLIARKLNLWKKVGKFLKNVMENSQIRENFIEKKSSYGSIVALMVWFVFKCTPTKEFLIEKDKHGSIVGFLVSFKKSLEKERFENDLEYRIKIRKKMRKRLEYLFEKSLGEDFDYSYYLTCCMIKHPKNNYFAMPHKLPNYKSEILNPKQRRLIYLVFKKIIEEYGIYFEELPHLDELIGLELPQS